MPLHSPHAAPTRVRGTGSGGMGTGGEDNSSIRRLGVLLRPDVGRLSAAVFTLVGLAAVNMLFPLPIKLLLDDIFPHSNWTLLWLTLLGLVLLYLARNVLYFYSKTAAVHIGENVCFNLRNRLFDRLQHMNLQYYKQTDPGQLTGRVMHDSFVIQTFIQDDLPKLLLALFLFLGLAAGLYAVNWQLALAATIVLPLHLMLFRKYKGPIKESSSIAQEQLAQVHGNLLEKFLGVEVVKGFTGEQRESEAFSIATDRSRHSQLRSKRYHVTQKIIGDLLVGVGTLALLAFGAFQVMGPPKMETGTFIAFLVWVGMLYPTVLELMSGLAKLTRSTASIDRVYELLESGQPEQRNRGASDTPIRGNLRFEGVCFAHDKSVPVLQHISFQVKAGQVCAIVGPSGAGKSTLVSLVPRFNEPNLGRVLLDDQDITKIELLHLRKHIGIAFQECFLFNSSILENLQYANPDAAMTQIIDVAQRTGAHEFILRLADGYDTIVGENGVILSRGQKQRINLTRAMLKNPCILILDEATASIDRVSEAKIIPAILEFMHGKTILMITHSRELLQHADTVIRLDDGRVTDQSAPSDNDLDLLRHTAAITVHDATDRDRDNALTHDVPADKLHSKRDIFKPLSMCLLLAVLAGACISAPAAAQQTAPVGKFIQQPELNAAEVGELLNIAATRTRAQLGYTIAGAAESALLPAPPDGVRGVMALAHKGDVQTRLIQLGFRLYKSQPVHVWLFGQTTTPDGPAAANEDVAAIETFISDAKTSYQQQAAQIKLADLATRKIKLSYIDSARCMQTLKVFGYIVGEPGKAVDPKTLPVIVALPSTQQHNLVGGKDKSFPLTESDPMQELLVFYHPARPEQFASVHDKIRKLIDVPARQIVIEAMVLEISAIGLKRLGIEWELESPARNLGILRFGRPASFATHTDNVPTLDTTLNNIFGEFSVTIQALIRQGHAKIKSHPSVLTLDNRMALISVVRRIPIVTSFSDANSNTINVKFTETIAGITLNVRPRVSADGKQISMQVVASVRAEVPNEDVVVTNGQGDVVARSPTISEREVRTYTRIANNMPFIIGGLVAEDDLQDEDKVPLLGDIPLIGPLLFTTQRSTTLKREVIIVITPRLLAENQLTSPALPKDDDAFDSFGNHLFRDAYRIRAEDVFDLGFLFENQQIKKFQLLADQIAVHNHDLARRYPIDRFTRGKVPGERILVYRQMYEVIKRRHIAQHISPQRILFFQKDEQSQSGFSIRQLWKFIAQKLGMPDEGDFPTDGRLSEKMEDRGGWALAMTYTMQHYQEQPGKILRQPVPHIEFFPCPDEQTYSRRLWQLNQPDDQGRQRSTILLHNEKDLTRLKRALVLKHTVHLNASGHALTLANFSLGRLLLIPTINEDQGHIIDEQTAKYFFLVEQYYPAMRHILTRDIQAMKATLMFPEVQQYLLNPAQVTRPLSAQPLE